MPTHASVMRRARLDEIRGTREALSLTHPRVDRHLAPVPPPIILTYEWERLRDQSTIA